VVCESVQWYIQFHCRGSTASPCVRSLHLVERIGHLDLIYSLPFIACTVMGFAEALYHVLTRDDVWDSPKLDKNTRSADDNWSVRLIWRICRPKYYRNGVAVCLAIQNSRRNAFLIFNDSTAALRLGPRFKPLSRSRSTATGGGGRSELGSLVRKRGPLSTKRPTIGVRMLAENARRPISSFTG
jgi:hypothetical protein